MTQISSKTFRKGGRLQLLHRLKMLEPVCAERLAQVLQISAQAVGQQLAALEKEGLVAKRTASASGRGRPQALWQATPAAAAHLADGHQELLGELLELLEARHGQAEVAQLLAQRTAKQLEAYRPQITAGTLGTKLEQLAQLRARDGYMAEARPEAEGLMLIEHHCPVHAVARRHRALCDEEKKLFEVLLGDGVRVERCEHALAGASRCSYLIRAERKTAASRAAVTHELT